MSKTIYSVPVTERAYQRLKRYCDKHQMTMSAVIAAFTEELDDSGQDQAR